MIYKIFFVIRDVKHKDKHVCFNNALQNLKSFTDIKKRILVLVGRFSAKDL